MKTWVILLTIVFSVSVSSASAETEKTRAEKLKEYRLEQYEEEVLAANQARGRVEIKFKDDRFGVVDALLNKKVNAALLVDTGASIVVISPGIAKALGLEDTSDKA